MKIFFDAEFYEDGQIIDLISIGMVREDGQEYYAEVVNAKEIANAIDWLHENVRPYLTGEGKAKLLIAREIVEFVGEKPEFWADYSAYDWVVLCQLFGTMMQLPKGWPMFCMDIKQLCVMVGDPKLPEQVVGIKHHALSDARWAKGAWEWLQKYKSEKPEPIRGF